MRIIVTFNKKSVMRFKITLLASIIFVFSTNLIRAQFVNTNFGTNGAVVTDFANAGDGFCTMTTLPDGKIMLFGSSNLAGVDYFGYSYTAINSFGQSYVLSAVKYNTDGSLDTSFGTNGKLFYHVDSYQRIVNASSYCVAQNDGKVILALTTGGLTKSRVILYRFLPNGVLDPDFGVNGTTYLESEEVYHVLLDANNNILVLGKKGLSGSVERLTPNGFSDQTFGTLGVSLITDNGALVYPKKAKVMNDNTILCFGETANNSASDDVIFFKVSENGSFDTTFGIKKITNGIYENDNYISQFEILPDSTLLVLTVGGYYNASFTALYAGRLYKIDLNGTPITSFNGTGYLNLAYKPYRGLIKILPNQNIFYNYITDTGGLNNFILTSTGSVVSQSFPLVNIGNSASVIFDNYLYVGYDNGDFKINGFMFDATLSVNHPDALSSAVFPNPVKDFVTIAVEALEGDNVQVEVYNLTGAIMDVFHKKSYQDDKQVFHENLSNYASGIYFLKIKSELGTKTVKVIKQ
jgi:uncharacterized delta-60 repeat protein